MGEWGPFNGVASESSEDEGDVIGKPFAAHFLLWPSDLHPWGMSGVSP